MNRNEFDARTSALRPRLMAIARGYLPASECEDAVQDAMLAAWEHLPQLRDESAFDSWLRQILVNRCYQLLRRTRRDRALAAELAAPPEAEPEETALNDALDHLSDEERRLLLLHHAHGYSIGELSGMTGKPEDALKMRMYRARRRLRVALISLLLLLLLSAAAVGSGILDVNWFLQNRRASEPDLYETDSRSVFDISYSGRFLAVECGDAIVDQQTLRLFFTYAIGGTDEDALTVHSGSLGVDGVRHDHIWIDDEILPVEEWARGRTVYTYALDGWTIGGIYPNGAEDFLMDGKGDSFFAELHLDRITPEVYETLPDERGMLMLTNAVSVRDYATDEILETGTLTLRVQAPSAQEWRDAYEAYDR